MKNALFDELVSSIKEAGKIHRGEVQASRTFAFEPDDIRKTRRSCTSHKRSSRR